MLIQNNVFSNISTFILSLLILGFLLPIEVIEAQALEEIIVTAQRREQSLQEVPISIHVVSGEEIGKQGYRNLEDLAVFSPNLMIDAGQMQTQSIRIRGVGTQSNNLALEQSVPMFVNGIHFGRGANVMNGFLDVERVEVLRGPQPIFFGQNASAGALSIVTRKPGSEWEGYISGEAGNDNVLTGTLAAGGPITETMGIRLATQYDSTEGFMTNALNGDKYPTQDSFNLRGTYVWTPMEALQLTLQGEYMAVNRGGRGTQPIGIQNNPITTLGAAVTGSGGFDVPGFAELINSQNVDKLNDVGLQPKAPFYKLPLTVFDGFGAVPTAMADLSFIANSETFDLLPELGLGGAGPIMENDSYYGFMEVIYTFANDMILTSKTAYTDLDRYFLRDSSSGGPFLVSPFLRFEQQNQWSQELRLESAPGGVDLGSGSTTIDWVVGLYYEDINLNTKGKSFRSAADSLTASTRNVQGNVHGEDDKWQSAFMNATVNFLDGEWALDAGFRYTDVSKDGLVYGRRAFWIKPDGDLFDEPADHGIAPVGLTPFLPTGNRTEAIYEDDVLNYQISLRWNPNDDASIYAKYATGFKAGGFDAGVTQVQPLERFVFGEETSKNYEIGSKGILLDGRMSYDLTLFWIDFKGLQRAALNPFLGRSVTDNVGSQRVKGVEVSGRYAVSDQLTMSFGGAINDAELTDFEGAACTQDERVRNLCTGPLSTIDRTGQEPPLTPNYVFTIGMDYWIPVLDRYRITFNGNFVIQDGSQLNFDQIFVFKQTEDLNLTMGFGPEDGKWSIDVFGRNLLEPLPVYQPAFDRDDEFETITLSASQFMTYGVKLQYNY